MFIETFRNHYKFMQNIIMTLLSSLPFFFHTSMYLYYYKEIRTHEYVRNICTILQLPGDAKKKLLLRR